MEKKTKNRLQNVLRFIPGGRGRWVILVVAVVTGLVLLGGLVKKKGAGNADNGQNIYTVERGDLAITVTESGSIKARKAIDIKSEVEGRVTIISIVPEGGYITQEDVNDGKILVELDSSTLREDLAQREIDFASAEASYAEATEGYDIQLNQNESDVNAAELKVKFNLMDFEKYLGQSLADKIIKDTNDGARTSIDIPSLVEHPQLSGESLQKRKELENNIILSEARFIQASEDLEWTKKLYEKKYVAASELKKDDLNKQSLEIKFEQSGTELQLFNLYDFPKQAEKLLSDYQEARRELERTYARTRSRLAQAMAKLKSAEARYNLRKSRVTKVKKQIGLCTIKAPGMGMVVYSSSENNYYRRSEGPIEVGSTVYQRQKIMSLPDTAEMSVKISVHESSVVKVKEGQSAKIVIEAFPDKEFVGKVLKVGLLPDQQSSWLNPGLKVYSTEISIEGTFDFLRPGMSAKAEIMIEELKDVIIVPVQVVANRNNIKACFVMTSNGPEQREVETGGFDETYVEVVSGLEVGEQVLMNPPRLIEPIGRSKTKGSDRPPRSARRSMKGGAKKRR